MEYMSINSKILKPEFRFVIYILTGVLSAIIGYANIKGWIGDPELTLWAGLSAIVNGLSAANVNSPDK